MCSSRPAPKNALHGGLLLWFLMESSERLVLVGCNNCCPVHVEQHATYCLLAQSCWTARDLMSFNSNCCLPPRTRFTCSVLRVEDGEGGCAHGDPFGEPVAGILHPCQGNLFRPPIPQAGNAGRHDRGQRPLQRDSRESHSENSTHSSAGAGVCFRCCCFRCDGRDFGQISVLCCVQLAIISIPSPFVVPLLASVHSSQRVAKPSPFYGRRPTPWQHTCDKRHGVVG